MSEIDLRKMPLHRKMEAYEKVCMVFFQKMYDTGKLTEEAQKSIRDEVWDAMKVFEAGHKSKIQCWMDFGEEFMLSLGVKDG